MTKRVFARNYRGFRRLSVPIDRNLFLVGDNSSGKSSILHLINLVCSQDLTSLPGLDPQHYVSRDDFFSPYFNYADVDIGLYVDDSEDTISRVITVSQDRREFLYYVKSCTFANDSYAVTLKVGRGKEMKGRVIQLSEVPDEDRILAIHKSRKGLKPLKMEYTATANDTTALFMTVSELVGQNAVTPSHMRALFSRPMPTTRHIGPMRGAPEGFYSFERQTKAGGAHFATLLNDVSKIKPDDLDKALKVFGSESELFDELKVSRATNSVPNSPLLVTIERNGRPFMLNQVGIGVSQIAPILAETLAAEKGLIPAELFLIQQPELHLHPKAQAALGDYMFALSRTGIGFCLETHSDFLIDRFRSNALGVDEFGESSIIYCTNNTDGNHSYQIDIGRDGKLLDPPAGYLDFFINELARTMV